MKISYSVLLLILLSLASSAHPVHPQLPPSPSLNIDPIVQIRQNLPMSLGEYRFASYVANREGRPRSELFCRRYTETIE